MGDLTLESWCMQLKMKYKKNTDGFPLLPRRFMRVWFHCRSSYFAAGVEAATRGSQQAECTAVRTLSENMKKRGKYNAPTQGASAAIGYS